MPRVNTWNGRWSGQDRLYAIVKNLGKSQKQKARGQAIIDNQPYSYDFGDGWSARVKVREIDVAEARKVRRASEGFYGYDWMVGSILGYGKIQTAAQREAEGYGHV